MVTRNAIFTGAFLIMSVISCFGQVKFSFTSDEHDFGVIEEGAKLTHTFEFTNSGKDTIHLKQETRDVRPGCSCTASEYTMDAIPSGGNGFIKAGYDTQGRIGTFNKTITVSQKNTPYKVLTIKGVVIKKTEKAAINPNLKKFPILGIDKKNHDFGKIEAGKTVSAKFILKNTGKDTLKISSYHSACNCINYKLVNIKELTEEKYIMAGKTVHLELNYAPYSSTALSDNLLKDVLTLFTNDPKNPKIELSLQSEIVEKK